MHTAKAVALTRPRTMARGEHASSSGRGSNRLLCSSSDLKRFSRHARYDRHAGMRFPFDRSDVAIVAGVA